MRASLKINTLITELVRYQQPERIHSSKYSMHQLLDEVLLMAADRLSLKNIIVSKNYAIGDYKKTADRPRMKIALTNIIINAIDAMKKQNGRLMLTTKLTDGRYSIQIEDNGCGIDTESVKHIFKPYFTSKEDGLGIGLAAVQNILKANKVRINVESEKGTGTKFTLAFAKRRTIFLVK
jgi:C4-dicarboxylate-specific signal transduction histidine kinase